ncbi:MAG TPA: aldehyde dehydrogenase family protein [Burkholderiales bacterium]
MNASHANLWIEGRWTAAESGAVAESIDPSTGEVLGRFADAGVADAERAIAAARRAFEVTDWAQAPRLRAQVLLAFAERVEQRAEALALLLARETGKLLKAAQAEIAGTVSELRFYAGLARTIFGRTTEVEPGALSILSREPAGVAGIIVPWNAASILLVRSLAPAMAAGCTSVVKMAPQSALFQTELLRCLAEVPALPPGVVNAYACTDSGPSEALVASPAVDVISFTGSCRVGQLIMAAAAPTLKRLNLELGGKAPALVFEDMEPEAVAPQLAAAATIASGQQCTALNRVLVHESLLDRMRDALARAFRAMVVGPAVDPRSEMGPLIDVANRDRIARLVDEARRWGEVVVRGEIPDGPLAKGAFIRPSLLEVSDVQSPIVQEEFFGPVLNLESFRDEAEAMARAHATRYGLSASVWTRDGARAQRVARALRSGTVWINTHNKLLAEAETGGFGASGFGRLHGAEAMLEFLETKHIYQEVGRIRR